METIVQHAAIRGCGVRRGPVIAGLAVALPLGVGAAPAASHSVPAHPVAAAVLAQPVGAGQIRTTVPVVMNHVAPGLVVNHVAPPPLASHPRVAIPAQGGVRGGECRGGLLTGTLMPFSEYMSQAHLERSPLQQVSDTQDADTYIRTHTVLMQKMIQPLWTDLFVISDGSTNTFLDSMYHNHFERSPLQQVSDMSQLDSFVKLHTVLVEHMLQPVLTALTGGC
jgi:hypothetical protein